MKTKVELQGKRAKSRHDLSYDVTTTSSFGFCQPMGVLEITPQSTVSKVHNIFVRAQPLVKPTYGRLKGHQYDVFVKTSDLYHPFPQLLAGQTFSGVTSYIPTFVPRIPLSLLRLLLCMNGELAVYNVAKNTVNFSVDELVLKKVGFTSSAGDISAFNVVESLLRSYTFVGSDSRSSSFAERLGTLFFHSSGTIAYTSTFNTLVCNRMLNSPADTVKTETDLTPLNADYVYVLDSSDFAHPDGLSGKYYICFRLSTRGRNIRKAMLGSGYQVTQSHRSVSLLPLMAYYKAWFDLFAPQRYLSWSSTPLFRLLEYIENYNLDFSNASTWLSTVADDVNYLLTEQFFKWWLSLGECYFTEAPDYVSSHITGASIASSSNFLRTTGPNGQDVEVVSGINEQAHVDNSSTGIPQALNVLSRAQLRAINFLAKYVNIRTVAGGRIDKFLKSVYGADYSCHESNFVNSDTFSIDISDVMNTAETSEGYLGEYAGKGLGLSKGSRLKYSPHEDKHGFLVSLFAIVPDSKYDQGVDPRLFHVEKFDFYTSGYDGISLVPNSKLSLYGTYDVVDPSMSDWMTSGSFGNIPVYSEYKQHQSILNGDCSLRSTRSSFLPFTLDKMLPYKDFSSYVVTVGGASKVRYSLSPANGITPASITNGTVWRYVGRYPWIGQYDRIFYNSGNVDSVIPKSTQNPSHDLLDNMNFLIDDNFIIHCYVDMSEFSNKLPLGESFDTGAEGDNDSLAVQHQ